jgi:cysteine desulfurase
MQKNIYMDYSATTPVDPLVAEAMLPFFSEGFGNASSVHAHGRKAKAALERSREVIAGELRVQPGEILFTSGGTESNNTALIGAIRTPGGRGKTHIITAQAEHQSILETCDYLESTGFEVSRLPVDRHGTVHPDAVAGAIGEGTGLVSIMHANNELGTLNDISAIGRLCDDHGVLFHTDAVQSFAKIPFDADDSAVDLLSLSAHKIYGPKGIGALYIRKGVEISRIQHGGGQERGRRGGTENVALAVGFARAVELMQQRRSEEQARLERLRSMLADGLQRAIDGVCCNTDMERSVPHILNVSIDASVMEIDGEALMMALDTGGLSVSNGSACTSGSLEPSHVQLAIGHDRQTAKSAIRFSVGRYTSDDDIRAAIAIVESVVRTVGRSSGSSSAHLKNPPRHSRV